MSSVNVVAIHEQIVIYVSSMSSGSILIYHASSMSVFRLVLATVWFILTVNLVKYLTDI